MPTKSRDDSAPWYRSFYWKVAFSFLVFVVVVLVAQSLVFNSLIARSIPGGSPRNLATKVAADLAARLTEHEPLNIEKHLEQQYGSLAPIYVMIRNGRIGDSPFSMAKIEMNDDYFGWVMVASPSPRLAAIRRLFSLPGTLLLVGVTLLAAVVIFEPARRRLQALERATQQLGCGDLTARAPERGRDEIARVSAAFNRMAVELAARDQALQVSDRLRRQMLADVSHELKTPLAGMRAYVETLRMADGTLDPATRERYFATLEGETLRLDRLVKDLVDLGRMENGVGAFDIRLFSTERVFEHIANRHEQEARARGIALRTFVGESADHAVGDPHRIEQVVENLIANAFRHTPDGGTIMMNAVTEDDAVVFSVTDSGAGIPPEHLSHVFDRFFKVDVARAVNGSGGSGLGLSITKAIVEAHGGTVGVTSCPGRTVFAFRLPYERVLKQAHSQSTSANL